MSETCLHLRHCIPGQPPHYDPPIGKSEKLDSSNQFGDKYATDASICFTILTFAIPFMIYLARVYRRERRCQTPRVKHTLVESSEKIYRTPPIDNNNGKFAPCVHLLFFKFP